MSNALVVSVLYLVVAVTMTVWLASTLYRNGIALLRERDGQHLALAEATSYLLVIGFSLFTLGYAFLLLDVAEDMDSMTALQVLVQRLGILLVSLALIHLGSTLFFLRFRRSRPTGEDTATSRRRRPPQRPLAEDALPSEQAKRR